MRNLTRMQLIGTLAAWRPDLSDYRKVANACRIGLKSPGRCYPELHDEIADLKAMIGTIVDELAPVSPIGILEPGRERRNGAGVTN